MKSPKISRVAAGTPGFYELRFNGEIKDQGENKAAEFCVRARELGAGAEVIEVAHPDNGNTPFGFHITVSNGGAERFDSLNA